MFPFLYFLISLVACTPAEARGRLRGAVGGSAPWEQVFLLDFTTAPTHDFKVTSTVSLTPTIGNTATWSSANAGTAVNLNINNTDGLLNQMPAGGTEQWSAATRTSPAVYATLEDLIGPYDPEDWISVQAYIDVASIPTTGADNRFQVLSIDPASLTGTNGQAWQGRAGGSQVGAAAGTLFQNAVVVTYSDIIELQVRGLRGEVAHEQPGAWGGNFPVPAEIPSIRGGSMNTAPGALDHNGTTDVIVMSAQNSGSAGSFNAKVNQISIWRRDRAP